MAQLELALNGLRLQIEKTLYLCGYLAVAHRHMLASISIDIDTHAARRVSR